MSLHIYRLFPEDPTFVPTAEAALLARDALAQYLKSYYAIKIEFTPGIVFMDQGELFESVACPHCGADLEMDWWKGEMDRCYESAFSDLSTVSPCCSMGTSLNELRYEKPAGFGRFCLSVEDYSLSELEDRSFLPFLEEVLGCKLRENWAWY